MTRRLGCIVFAVAVVAALAPGARAESIFGLNLVGERIDAGDARAMALGGAGQLLDDSLAVLQLNPAMISIANKVTFGVSQYFASDLSRSEAGQEQEVGAKFTGFAFTFPLFTKFTLGFAYRGRYDPDGGFTTHDVSSAGDPYRTEFIREGGLNSYQFMAATRVTRFARLGGYVSYETGRLKNRWNTIFDSSAQQPAYNIQDRTMSGTGWGAGAVISPSRSVMLGVVYEGKIDYDVDVLERYTNSAASGSYGESMTLPAALTASAAWHGRHFAAYATASMRDFKNFEGLAFPADRLEREESAGLGVEYLRGFPLFGRRFPVRLSMSYERLPYTYPEGERVQRVVAALGTGLILSDGRGKIDFAIQTGRIGSRNTNGLDTRVLRLFVGISGAEIWKHKRESAY